MFICSGALFLVGHLWGKTNEMRLISTFVFTRCVYSEGYSISHVTENESIKKQKLSTLTKEVDRNHKLKQNLVVNIVGIPLYCV